MIGGVHGSGKTSICHKLGHLIPDIIYVSASRLINHDVTYKHVDDIKKNQQILINKIQELKETHDLIIIDGHFCVTDKEGEMKYVGEEIFRILSPELLVLVQAPTLLIQQRITLRDHINYSDSLIEEWKEKETFWAEYTSITLNLPLMIVEV